MRNRSKFWPKMAQNELFFPAKWGWLDKVWKCLKSAQKGLFQPYFYSSGPLTRRCQFWPVFADRVLVVISAFDLYKVCNLRAYLICVVLSRSEQLWTRAFHVLRRCLCTCRGWTGIWGLIGRSFLLFTLLMLTRHFLWAPPCRCDHISPEIGFARFFVIFSNFFFLHFVQLYPYSSQSVLWSP